MTDKAANTETQEPKTKGRKTLEERKALLLAKIQRHEDEKKRLETKIEQLENTPSRKRDTRRKILFGVTILEMMEKDPELAKKVLKQLDLVVTREDDRKLLGLAPHK